MMSMEKLSIFQKPIRIAIAGASGGIGGALCELCQQSEQVETIYALSRQPVAGDKIQHFTLDYNNLESLDHLANIESIDILVIATGVLTLQSSGPEKRIDHVSEAELSNLYHTNALGPILLARSLHRALAKKETSICMVMSARVGSIADNRLGGWYAYRASKAALNMLFKSYSIEVARQSGLIVSLYHPGTVSTNGFKDYQTHMDPSHIKQPRQVAEDIWRQLGLVNTKESGTLIDYNGDIIPF